MVWTEQAPLRLAGIEEYIVADNLAAALAQTARIIQRAEALADFPEMGRRLPEILLAPFRELIIGNCRLVYSVHTETVEVLTVFDSHRLLPESDLTIEEWPSSGPPHD